MSGVIILGLVGGGFFIWLESQKDELRAMGIEAEEEAKKFAASTDSEGCLQEALSRIPAHDTLLLRVRNGIFLYACLESAEYTPGFCDDVPEKSLKGAVDVAMWCVQQCDSEDPHLQECSKLWKKVVDFCSDRKQQAN